MRPAPILINADWFKSSDEERSSVVIWIALFATLLIGGCFVAAAGGIVA